MRRSLANALVALGVAAFLFRAASASGEVIIENTRIVMPADDVRGKSVKLTNVGNQPALVQLWLDDGQVDADPANLHVPIVVTPSIARIERKRGQVVRLMNIGQGFPADRESLYWFNMLEVPKKVAEESADKNVLRFAVRTRIKVFVRPSTLAGTSEKAIDDLQWSLVNDNGTYTIKIRNESAYYVSFSKLDLVLSGRHISADGDGLVPPRASVVFKFRRAGSDAPESVIVGATPTIEATAVNDYGGFVDLQPKLSPP